MLSSGSKVNRTLALCDFKSEITGSPGNPSTAILLRKKLFFSPIVCNVNSRVYFTPAKNVSDVPIGVLDPWAYHFTSVALQA